MNNKYLPEDECDEGDDDYVNVQLRSDGFWKSLNNERWFSAKAMETSEDYSKPL